jgi:hypothetical protein
VTHRKTGLSRKTDREIAVHYVERRRALSGQELDWQIIVITGALAPLFGQKRRRKQC